MSLGGPAFDGAYQATFSAESDLDTIRIETIGRARRAGYEIAGEVTVAIHHLSYHGEFDCTVVVATVAVSEPDLEAVPA
jgi:hypothetical protein